MGHGPNSNDTRDMKKKKILPSWETGSSQLLCKEKGTAKKDEERRRHVVENIRLWSERARAGVVLDAGGVFASSGATIGYSKEK